MKLLTKLLLLYIGNAFAIFLAASFIEGVVLTGDIFVLLTTSGILTLIHFFIKPVLKLLLGPIVILTLGIALFFINALLLYLLDFISKDLTIENISALALTTLLVSVVGFIASSATKS